VNDPPAAAQGIKRHIPNLLVIARLLMTAAMIGVLSVYRFPDVNAWTLPTATALFVVAAITDWLDGFLARRWNAISVFGRIMDPTADKILVLGAFVMLAGPGFLVPPGYADDLAGAQVSGVHAWMAIVILSRELLVTAMRGSLESRGVDFSASLSGKLKMVAQSAGAPLIMVITMIAALSLNDGSSGPISPRTGVIANIVVATIITLISAASALPYITRARKAMSGA